MIAGSYLLVCRCDELAVSRWRVALVGLRSAANRQPERSPAHLAARTPTERSAAPLVRDERLFVTMAKQLPTSKTSRTVLPQVGAMTSTRPPSL